MNDVNVGKLVHRTNELCEECGEGHIEIRSLEHTILVKGIDITEKNKYKFCPVCSNQEKFEDKKQGAKNHRRKIDEVISDKKRYAVKTNSNRSPKRNH